jgi:hypothetical protein
MPNCSSSDYKHHIYFFKEYVKYTTYNPNFTSDIEMLNTHHQGSRAQICQFISSNCILIRNPFEINTGLGLNGRNHAKEA